MSSETRICRTWRERLDSGVLTKAQILQFSAHITPRAEGVEEGGKRSMLTTDECRSLLAQIREHPVGLTTNHMLQGREWLLRYAAKLLHLSPDVAERIGTSFARFTWDGNVEYIDAGYHRWRTVPIWTLHLADGATFQYYYASGWRSGRGHAGEFWQVVTL